MLKRQTDERAITETKAEILVIPSGSCKLRLEEVPSQDSGVEIRRIGPTVKTGAGFGSFQSGGTYTGLSTKNYKIEIDTAGEIGVATFKWSNDGGLTWQRTLVPIPDTDPIGLESGVTITPSAGAETDFELGDYWLFSAEYWTEVIYVPTQSKEYQVDYTNGDVLFHVADAEKEIHLGYEGRGSVVDAEDINQLIDVLDRGEVVMRNVDTSGLTVNKAVAVLAADVYQYANATGGTKPAIGFVKVSDDEFGEVITHGPLSGFTGLTFGGLYYLDIEDGEITLVKRQSGQVVGRALSDTELFVNIEEPFVPGDCLSLSGKCNSDMTGSTTDIYSAEFIGFGDDYFNTKFYVQVIKNANSVGNTPETQVRKINDYVSATGKFITDAFGANVEANDDIMVIHESIVSIGTPTSRTNLKSLEAMLGNPDAAGKTVYGDIGDFIGQTNLQSLLAALGIPDTTAKPLYTCLITDRLDHGTFGLSALKALIDSKVAGRAQSAVKTIDLQQVAETYDLFIGTTQDVLVESLLIRLPNVDVSDDANITSISIQTDDATPLVFISAAQGVKGNLKPEITIPWTGATLLKIGKKIRLTIAGGAADASTVCDIVVKCRAVVSGGYLA